MPRGATPNPADARGKTSSARLSDGESEGAPLPAARVLAIVDIERRTWRGLAAALALSLIGIAFRPTTHPDRHLDCEEAIEGMFQAVAATAETVGWTRHETAATLISLAENHALAIAVNDAIAEFGAGVFLKAPKLYRPHDAKRPRAGRRRRGP